MSDVTSTAATNWTPGSDEAIICTSSSISSSGQGPETFSSQDRARAAFDPLQSPQATVDESRATPDNGRLWVTADQIMIAFLAERIARLMRAPKDLDLGAISDLIGAMADKAIPASPGQSGHYESGATRPTDALTRALRAASGYEASGLPSMEEARRLADSTVTSVLACLGWSEDDVASFLNWTIIPSDAVEEEGIDRFDELVDALWDESDPAGDEPPVWEEPAPSADDPLVTAVSTSSTAATMIGLGGVPKKTVEVFKSIGVKHLRKLRALSTPFKVRQTLRAYQGSKKGLDPQSQADGKVAEAVLWAEYLKENPSARILCDTRVGPGGPTLGDSQGDPIWQGVKLVLLNLLSGRLRRPDLLDADKSHVYEIKPMRNAEKAGSQLATLLFWLNLGNLIEVNTQFSAIELAAWAARLARVGGTGPTGPPFPLNKRNPTLPAKIWIPGPWVPKKTLPAPGGRLLRTDVPLPGIICYQLVNSKKKLAEQATASTSLSPETMMRMIAALMVSWVAVREAGKLAGGDDKAGATAVAAWLEVTAPSSFSEQSDKGDDELATGLIVLGTVLVVAGLIMVAPVVMPVLAGAAAEIFVVGGAEALVLATSAVRR